MAPSHLPWARGGGVVVRAGRASEQSLSPPPLTGPQPSRPDRPHTAVRLGLFSPFYKRKGGQGPGARGQGPARGQQDRERKAPLPGDLTGPGPPADSQTPASPQPYPSPRGKPGPLPPRESLGTTCRLPAGPLPDAVHTAVPHLPPSRGRPHAASPQHACLSAHSRQDRPPEAVLPHGTGLGTPKLQELCHTGRRLQGHRVGTPRLHPQAMPTSAGGLSPRHRHCVLGGPDQSEQTGPRELPHTGVERSPRLCPRSVLRPTRR